MRIKELNNQSNNYKNDALVKLHFLFNYPQFIVSIEENFY
jgi:hypothetical protein